MVCTSIHLYKACRKSDQLGVWLPKNVFMYFSCHNEVLILFVNVFTTLRFCLVCLKFNNRVFEADDGRGPEEAV